MNCAFEKSKCGRNQISLDRNGIQRGECEIERWKQKKGVLSFWARIIFCWRCERDENKLWYGVSEENISFKKLEPHGKAGSAPVVDEDPK